MKPRTAVSLFASALLLILLKVDQVYPRKVFVIQEGEGFVAIQELPPNSSSLKSCTVLDHSNPYNLSTHLLPGQVGQFIERTIPCGMKWFNVGSESNNSNWTLSAESETGVKASLDFQLQVIPTVPSDEVPKIWKGRPGSSLEIRCNEEGEFCEMWAEGQEASKTETCVWKNRFPDDVKTKQEIRCRTFSKGSMKAVTKKWTVIGQYPDTTPEYVNGPESVILRCKSGIGAIKACYMENLKTGEMFQIADGLSSNRGFSSYQTKLSDGVCEFEIPKPVEDNNVRFLMKVHYPQQGKRKRNEECYFDVAEIRETPVYDAH